MPTLIDEGHQMALRLRDLISRPKGVFAFGISNPVDAIAAELAEHEVLYVGGYAASAIAGFTDHGFLTATEMLQHMQYVTDVATIPCIGDADDCYGGVLSVKRIVHNLFTRTSLAAIHIEDQSTPKRCGHIAGKKILSLEQFLGKLSAAIYIRNKIDPARLIIARTDAFNAVGRKKNKRVGGDIGEAVKRGIAYAKAGADLVWCEFPDAESVSAKAFATGIHKELPGYPLAINISPSFRDWLTGTKTLSRNDIIRWGYKLPFSTYPSLQAEALAVYLAAKEFKKDFIEGIKSLKRRVAGTPAESIMKLLGVDKILEFERKFDSEAVRNQETSDGFKG